MNYTKHLAILVLLLPIHAIVASGIAPSNQAPVNTSFSANASADAATNGASCASTKWFAKYLKTENRYKLIRRAASLK